jgi:mono/diheme cytochrome c family protein
MGSNIASGWTAAVFCGALGGCVGNYAPGTPGTPGTPSQPIAMISPNATARQMFDQTVAPLLQATCAGCHAGAGASGAPVFLGAGPGAFYTSLVSDARFVNAAPAQSELLTQGKHEGPALTPDQGAAVEAWLTKETAERSNLPPPPPPSNLSQRSLDTFGTCMTLDDYTSSGMGDLQNQTTAGNGGSCVSCHQTGMYVFLSNSPQANFDRLHTMPWIMKFAIADVGPDGSFRDIVAANRFRDRGQETGHPAYTLSAARATALSDFFTRTYAHYKAGGCTAAPPTAPADGGVPKG